MKTYKVDLDYESFLFDPDYIENSPPSLKIIKEYEYIFFLINKVPCILKNQKSYEKNYLNKLERLGFFIPTLKPDAKTAESWWGNRHDYAIEQTLNSKITSAELGQKNHWGFFEGAIVESVEEIKIHLAKYPQKKKWIVKKPHSFSGIGHYHFSSDSLNEFIIKKVLSGKVLLEPLYDRVFDIGTTFVMVNGIIERQFMVENHNSEQGGFRGGTGASDVDKFKKYILERYNYSLNELESTTKKIADEYKRMGAINNIQIDSFVYRENDELKLYPLVEMNYRKTMGLVIQSLADKFPETEKIDWIVRTKKDISEDKDFYKDESLVRLSPDDTHFQSFYKKYVL